jgi:spore coat polysaccharide biosynthesis protein SpsF
MENVKVLIITQARVGSTRLPEKVLKDIGGQTMLALHINRLAKSERATAICVATTFEEKSDLIVDIANSLNVDCFKGNTTDVLDRFYQAAKKYEPDYVVRVTSDCPLIDGKLIDAVIEMTIKDQVDYGSNALIESFPDGQDIEVIKWSALQQAWKEATKESDREHVTPFIRRNSDFNGGEIFKANNFQSTNEAYAAIRMTVDEMKDLEAIRILIDKLGVHKSWMEYAAYYHEHPSLFENKHILRNEGYFKSLKKDK